MDELKTKFMKHRQILTANYEQAEDEVKRLDEIFHETVNQVLQVSQQETGGQSVVLVDFRGSMFPAGCSKFAQSSRFKHPFISYHYQASNLEANHKVSLTSWILYR